MIIRGAAAVMGRWGCAEYTSGFRCGPNHHPSVLCNAGCQADSISIICQGYTSGTSTLSTLSTLMWYVDSVQRQRNRNSFSLVYVCRIRTMSASNSAPAHQESTSSAPGSYSTQWLVDIREVAIRSIELSRISMSQVFVRLPADPIQRCAVNPTRIKGWLCIARTERTWSKLPSCAFDCCIWDEDWELRSFKDMMDGVGV